MKAWWLPAALLPVACVAATKAGDDDDDDDDDVALETTDSIHSFTEPEYLGRVEFRTMTVYGQFDVVDGQVVGGASFIELAIGPGEWDYTDYNDDNYCVIQAELVTGTNTLLANQDVTPPFSDVGDGSTAVTDCPDVFNVDPRLDVALVIAAIPEWGVAIASGLSPSMDPSGLPAPYDGGALGAYWNVPILQPSVNETVLAFSYDPTGSLRPAAQVHGQPVLPNGQYFSLGPVIDVDGFFVY